MDKRVMIVEDSYTVRYEVKLILEKIGLTLVETANEIGMLNLMEEYGKCVDLILMDVVLKEENGFDLIAKIKAYEKYKNIPVVMLTEHADSGSVLKARELGVSGYLRKPLKKDDLVEKVKSLLDI
ncbi:MAG TPA: response regulator [Clostridia bacterium]